MMTHRSVVIACLKKIDAIIRHAIDKPVLLRDPPRPAAFQHIAKRFGFPNAREWITHDCLDKIKEADSRIAFGFDPV